MDDDIETNQEIAESTPAYPTPAMEPGSQGARGKIKKAANCANERIHKLTWPEIAIAAAAGFAVGWLIATPRRNPSFRNIVEDNIFPWASRNIHGAADSVRHSRPVDSIRDGISRLRAS